ncbi:T9SS type A sorting domain-containing protein [Flavihumibacter fluvii]|uniref:T9SS type A sorting domain-containing protein n=1 Tax=Flavihumibacter fluvii TaxID=2838157 RepID=UPI001BDEEA83|nr:T9SS type A sorting domain-containing protein [Flavihumibacter fluvii]ULQ50670.1 S8 family serine peptidase [Flavihumibacter fluvii]
MKKLYLGFLKLLSFGILLQLTLVSSLKAQQLNRASFVVFGVNGVQFNSSNTLTGAGSVGSNTLVKSTGGLAFPANINSGGKIELGNGNSVAGKTTAANGATLTGNILFSGSSAIFNGDIVVKGAISISGATVASSAKIYQPAGAAYVGPASATKALLTDQLPQLPAMPTNTPITPNTTKINSTTSKGPGTYGDVTLSGNRTLTLTGPGTYIFNSFTLNNTNQIIFDFGGTTSGKFNIYVKGTMMLDKVGASYIGLPAGQANKDAAARIYTEVQGVVATGASSFVIANGSSSSRSKWLGTVWASNGNITVGSGTGNSDYTGALWSGKQVIINSGVNTIYAPLVEECINPAADAGQSLNPTIPCTGLTPSVQLQGSSTGITNPSYSWTTVNGNIVSGQNTPTPTVTTAGTYVLVVSNSTGCTATAEVKVKSCVDLAVDGNPFKVETKVDAILTKLIGDPTYINTPYLFTFDPNNKSRILIEAILQDNTLATANSALIELGSNGFSQTSISNNDLYYIITGFIPISNIPNLEIPILFNEIRAVVPPIGLAETGGLYRTGGDSAIGTRSARAGYDITGAQYKSKDGSTKNIKIGVISDSYNKKGAAANDIATGELPAVVELPNGDFPFGGDKSDEGRAMMQIIHEQAPGAKLAFRTGFISEGDMAEGIRQLRDAGCNIIVDDITYATTPFFRDGLVTKAIKEVVKDSVLYFTSAGNFGNKAYEGKFSAGLANGAAVPIPGVVAPQNNTLQRIELSRAGTYMIILQWDDFFYSVNDPGVTQGAVYDLDIYLTDYTGKNILGYNRINTGSDPLEIMPFTVADATTVYLKIVKASGPAGSGDVSYKYIIFRGSGKILDNANANPSTIIGHANSQEAMTVGAVQYNLTPAYGVASNLVKVEPFSSWGGPSNGIDNKKPDFSAPDGVNTSVYLGDRPLTDINGGVYLDAETKPGLSYNNFFGTSAAAPHAAGLAALLLETRLKYNPTKPAFGYKNIKNVFKSTASNILDASDDATGFDYKSGSGLIDAYKALLTEANPKPLITSIKSVETTTTPDGKVQINIVVDGNYLVTTTYIEVNGVQVPTTVDLATKTLTAIIEPFTGNPEVKVCSPSIAAGDGQCSNSINLLDPTRTKITVRAKPYTKTYGTPLPPDANAPPFQYEILIGDSPTAYDPSQPLPGGLTLIDLGLAKPGLQPGDPAISTVRLTTTASNTSTAGQPQVIHPSIEGFEPTIPLEYAKLYNYVIADGVLTVERLKVNITPKSQTITYGEEVGLVEFDYTTPGTSNVDPAILQEIKTEHTKWIANSYALVKGFDASRLSNSNLAMMITETGLFNATSGATRANGGVTRANVVDVSPEALDNFLQNRILSNGGVTRANGIPYDNAATRANGGITRANGGITRANTIVNADALINGFIVVTSNGGVTRANVSGGDPNANGGVTRANGITRANYITFTEANGITRANVVLNSDVNKTEYAFAELDQTAGNTTTVNAIPNSGIENGVLTNSGGDVTLVNSSLFSATSNSNVAVLVDDEDVSKGYVEGYVSINMVTGLNATNGTPHLIIPGAFLPLNPNFDISYGTGDLVVNKAPLAIAANTITKIYGEPVEFTNTVTGYLYNPETDIQDNTSIVYPSGISNNVTAVINSIVVPFTGPIYPVGSYTIQPIFGPVNNYVIDPPQGSNGVLNITPAEQTITWDNPAAIKYGTPLSSIQLNATVAGVTDGSDPGALTYTPAAGTYLQASDELQNLKVDAAATADYTSATKTVSIKVDKADLTVTMGQAIYYFTQGSSVPAITSSIAGLAPGDAVSNNSYVTTTGVAISSSMPAGEYTILRNITTSNLTNFSSYNILNTVGSTAKLYVNPSGGNIKSIRPVLECIEQDGTNFRAKYSWQNANTVPVYVPLGDDNKIILSPGAIVYGGTPPEVFPPGSGTFYITFNGIKITWYIASIEKNKKSSSSSDATSSSNKCNSGNRINNLARETPTDVVIRETIYPNPANNQVFIEGDFNKVSEKDIIIVDGIGRQMKPASIQKLSSRRMQINISNLSSSQYFIKVNTITGKKVYKFIKL